MVAPTTLYKITAGLVALFSTMHIFANQWFMDLNFENIGTMDDKHVSIDWKAVGLFRAVAGSNVRRDALQERVPSVQRSVSVCVQASSVAHFLLLTDSYEYMYFILQNFFARVMGINGLFYAGLLVQLDDATAAKLFPWQTLFIISFYVCGPLTATGLVFEPLEGAYPPKADFWPGFPVFTLLVLAYVYTLVTGGYRTKETKAQ